LLFALLAVLTLAGQEPTHFSQVMGGPRAYNVYLPANYAASQKRYPVIYWMHSYEAGNDTRGEQLAAYAAKHDVIIVDSGPADTSGNYRLYLPELVDEVDRSLRTIADRDHRGYRGSMSRDCWPCGRHRRPPTSLPA